MRPTKVPVEANALVVFPIPGLEAEKNLTIALDRSRSFKELGVDERRKFNARVAQEESERDVARGKGRRQSKVARPLSEMEQIDVEAMDPDEIAAKIELLKRAHEAKTKVKKEKVNEETSTVGERRGEQDEPAEDKVRV